METTTAKHSKSCICSRARVPGEVCLCDADCKKLCEGSQCTQGSQDTQAVQAIQDTQDTQVVQAIQDTQDTQVVQAIQDTQGTQVVQVMQATQDSQTPPGSQENKITRGVTRLRERLLRSKKDFSKSATKTPPNEQARETVTVKKGHSKYVLMYDMLTGIRVAVSRCQAKLPQPLVPEDFTTANKIAFDVTGNELTPSSLYDFKFKDYAPRAFREIRRGFCVDPAEYLVSLTNRYMLSERSSPGKSGAFLYYSADYRFIIKTIRWSEHMVLRKFLKSYFEHVFKYPNTLISRIFGLHRVKLPMNKKVHFIVMDNILPFEKEMHALYDLKGSLLGRRASPEELSKGPGCCVLKDLDWLERKTVLKLGPVKKEIFMRQLVVDLSFLASHDIMDYSLLVGIHNKRKGNSKTRGKNLSLFEPSQTNHTEQIVLHQTESGRRERANALKSVLSRTDPVTLETSSALLKSREDRKNFMFYKNEGGFASTDADNRPGDEIYYMGIIDIFTKFGPLKMIESSLKSFRYKHAEVSAVNSQFYSERLLTFISQSITSTAK